MGLVVADLGVDRFELAIGRGVAPRAHPDAPEAVADDACPTDGVVPRRLPYADPPGERQVPLEVAVQDEVPGDGGHRHRQNCAGDRSPVAPAGELALCEQAVPPAQREGDAGDGACSDEAGGGLGQQDSGRHHQDRERPKDACDATSRHEPDREGEGEDHRVRQDVAIGAHAREESGRAGRDVRSGQVLPVGVDRGGHDDDSAADHPVRQGARANVGGRDDRQQRHDDVETEEVDRARRGDRPRRRRQAEAQERKCGPRHPRRAQDGQGKDARDRGAPDGTAEGVVEVRLERERRGEEEEAQRDGD